jgi:hypothetical protein
MKRLTLAILTAMTALLVLTGCSVSTSLVPAMAEEDGRFGFDTHVSQPFYSSADGLHKLTIRFYPEGFPGSQVPVDASQGSAIILDYAPQHDPRFPEPAFHEWPEHHEWLPEMISDVRYAQTFCSPYPDLSGIEVRVATFGADLSPGTGVLQPFDTVEVLELPVVGQHAGFIPGGSEVEVVAATEGWARVLLNDGQAGWIRFDNFAELPEPHRTNDKDVVLELYELDGDEPIRDAVVNAEDMYDISHVTFEFDRVEDALDQCFRFEISSPESSPGNAITFRFDPEGDYDRGNAILNGDAVDGDIIFQPLYDLQEPLYRGFLDDYEWAAPLDAFEARFDPVDNTADRYLEIRVESGNVPINVPWSRNRPPGQRPLMVGGQPDAPQGGLIFNAAFYQDVPVGDVSRIFGRDLFSRARMDQLFFGGLGLILIGTVVGGALIWRRGDRDGG